MRKVFFSVAKTKLRGQPDFTSRKPAEVPAYQFHLLQKFSDQVGHAVFSRDGGTSKKPYDSLNVRFGVGDRAVNVSKNRRLICNALEIEPKNLVSANQTHSKNVKIIDKNFLNRHGAKRDGTKTDFCDDLDALVTEMPGVAPMIQVADCQAILMFDASRKVVAAVHAGWKGLAQNISGETIKVLKNVFAVNPANLLVGIAPSLGPCCAFFSNPEKELPESFQKFVDKQRRVDLWEFSLEQLRKAGIKKEHIELSRVCTQCNNGPDIESRGRFYSHRGEKGITGRFGAVIYLK